MQVTSAVLTGDSVLVPRQSGDHALRVREYASDVVISVRPETPLVDVHELLLENDISAVPVLDRGGRLVGILSTTDLLREAQIEVSAPGEVMRIVPAPRTAADLMRREVITVDRDAPLRDAARAMLKHRIHRVVVTSSGAPAGVLTTRDAMRAVIRERITSPLESVMTSPVETIDQGDTIRMAIQRLADECVHGLVVVDGSWPIGVFTHT